MSLLNRKPRPISRALLKERDDRIFFVATEDRYAAAQYLGFLREARVHIVVLPTEEGMASAASHVVARLAAKHTEAKKECEILEDDEFWILVDTDHQINEAHKSSFVAALNDARGRGFKIAVSNPCFELWLLLHHESVERNRPLNGYSAVEDRLRAKLGGYNKTNLKAEHFPPDLRVVAIERARSLENDPNNPSGYWPDPMGSRVYLLLEAILRLR
ncbi:MAG: RloB family protein [Nibricoccus sp.]